MGATLAYPGHILAEYINGLLDKNTQIQPAGVDLRVRSIYAFTSRGGVSFRSKDLPHVREVRKGVGRCWELGPGAYKVRFSEIIQIPEEAIGLCLPRSSLLRSGVDVRCALWDPGYRGRGEALLIVFNPNGFLICDNARVAQLVLIKLISPPKKLYSGSYLGENINE